MIPLQQNRLQRLEIRLERGVPLLPAEIFARDVAATALPGEALLARRVDDEHAVGRGFDQIEPALEFFGRRWVLEDLEHALEQAFVDQSAADQPGFGDLGAHRAEAP